MSGAEVIGLISAIISIIDTSLKVVEALDDASGLLPQAFRNVAARLPLVQDTLRTARTGLAEEEGKEDEEGEDTLTVGPRVALVKILKSCRDKVSALNDLVQAVKPAAGASGMERTFKAFKTISSTDKAEKLMDGILGDLQVLTANHAIKAATRAEVQCLVTALRERDGSHYGSVYSAVAMNNMGSGSQYSFTGRGNMNVVSGGGIQINGESTAPFYISQTKG